MNKENWPKLDAGVAWKSGFLVDTEIKRAMENNQLVREGNPDFAKYATYELHIGGNVQQLVMDDNGDPNRDIYKAKNVPEDGTFTIQPGETFKIYAAERVTMPADVFALAVPVGIMYKLGLNPETTFADPGFDNAFYITVCNYSPRVVRLKVGDPLARLFFCRVRERPDRIHESNPREMPPAVERVKRPSPEELEAAGEANILNNVLRCVDPPHYQHAYVTNRVIGIQRQAVETDLANLRRQLSAVRFVALITSGFVAALLGIFSYRALWGKWPGLTEGTFSSLIANVIWFGLGAAAWYIYRYTSARGVTR